MLQDAITNEAGVVWRYGDPDNFDLKTSLSHKHNVGFENIIIDDGIDGLLGFLVRLFVTKDIPVVTKDGAYQTFNYYVAGFDGSLIKVPFRNEHEDPVALLKTAHETKARLVYFSNPNNPMGSFHGPEVIQHMLSCLPTVCLRCFDGSYADFVDEADLPVIDSK